MKLHVDRRSALCSLVLVCGLFACVSASSRVSHDAQSAVRIPFTLTPENNISIHAILNDVDRVDLMFHTAVDSISLTKVAIARLSTFNASESVAVHSWGGDTQARHSTGNSLRIGALAWNDLSITEDDNSGTGTDGKFGPSLFAGQVVEIDFDASELIIHASLPAVLADREQLDLSSDHGAMFVSGELQVGDVRCTTQFMLHTGFGGTALIDEQLLREHDLVDKLDTLSERTLHDSYGSAIKTRTVRLPALRIGNTSWADVPAGMFDGVFGSRRMSVLGAGLLKRFNLVFDADRRHVYVSPSKFAATPLGS